MNGQLPPMLAGGLFTPIKNGEVNGVSGDAAAMNAFRAADRQVGGARLRDRRPLPPEPGRTGCLEPPRTTTGR